MYVSQVVNGIVLPVVLVFMILLISDKKLMGEYANKKVWTAISWATVVILSALTAAYIITLII
jgi:Mn2+/Fe2+ NRAMP family transporter